VSVGLHYAHFDTIFENLSDYDTTYGIFSKKMQQLTIQEKLGGE
jgi:hypothetical protein